MSQGILGCKNNMHKIKETSHWEKKWYSSGQESSIRGKWWELVLDLKLGSGKKSIFKSMNI